MNHYLRLPLGGLVGALVLSGCGVTLKAERVALGAGGVVPGEGIVYALPKTTFDIVQPVAFKGVDGGPLTGVWDSCESACNLKAKGLLGAAEATQACTPDLAPSLVLGVPELKTRTVPDLNRLYRIKADAQLFQSLNIKMDIDQAGVMRGVESSASNTGYEVVTDVVKNLIPFAISAFTGTERLRLMSAPFAMFEPKKPEEKDCFLVARDMDALTKKKEWGNVCANVADVNRCVAPAKAALKNAREAYKSVMADILKPNINPRASEMAVEFHKDRVDAAKANLAAALEGFGLGEMSNLAATYVVTLPAGAPDESQPGFNAAIELSKALKDKTAVIAGVSDNAAKYLAKTIKLLGASKVDYSVTVTKPVRGTSTASAEPEGEGYRYRVPIETPVAFVMTEKISKKNENNVDVDETIVRAGSHSDLRMVAQYGPISALTSTFVGKGGKVNVKLWPDSGGIQTVEIGADALPTSAVTGPIDDAFAQYKAKKDAAKAAATAAAGVDPELEQLKSEEAKKALKKKIKEYDDFLNGK